MGSQVILLSAAGTLSEKSTDARELTLLLVLLPASLMPMVVAVVACLTITTAVLPKSIRSAMAKVWLKCVRLRRCASFLGFRDAATDAEKAKRHLQVLLQQDPHTQDALLTAIMERMDPLEARQLVRATKTLFAVAQTEQSLRSRRASRSRRTSI